MLLFRAYCETRLKLKKGIKYYEQPSSTLTKQRTKTTMTGDKIKFIIQDFYSNAPKFDGPLCKEITQAN